MVIQHVMAADFAAMQNKKIQKENKTSMERLSSGYRINRAGDDAAGLTISEKLRAQIRAMEKAKKSVDDGVALIHAADGAMQEMNNILVRMREIAVQAANDTNTDDDRAKSQLEVKALTDELDRIANQTEYNTMKILNNTWYGDDTRKTLADIVGKSNITPTGSLSEVEQASNIINYLNGAVDVTSVKYPDGSYNMNFSPVLTIITERSYTDTITTRAYTNIKDLAGNAYTGDIYDGSGNLIGSSAAGAGTTTMPVQTTPLTTRNIQSGEYIDPAANTVHNYNGGAGTPDSVNTVTNTNLTSGGEILYQKDASGNLVLLSRDAAFVQTVDKTVNTFRDYADYNETLKTAHIDFQGLNKPNGFKVEDLYGMGFNSTCATCDNHYSVKFTGGTDVQFQQKAYNDYVLNIGIGSLNNTSSGEDFAQLLIDALKSPDAGAFSTHYTQYSKIGSSIYIFDRRHSVTGSGMDTFDPIVFVTDTDQEHHFRIQTGADSGQEMGMQLPWVTTDKLRIRGISVLSHDAASAGLSMVDRATDYLNGERSRMGAYENRLKHAGKKLDVQRLHNPAINSIGFGTG